LSNVVDMAIAYAPKLIMAIVVLLVGLWAIRKIISVVGKMMKNSGMTEEVRPILLSIIDVILKVLLIFSVAGIIGIETSSFIAALAAASFAVGMALQGSLGHLAAGIMILIFRPYKIGDYIKVGDHEGFVIEIQILNTILNTLDDRNVVIPNGNAISDAVVNSSGNEKVRLEFFTFIPYNENLDRVREVVVNELLTNDKIAKDPAPFVGIHEFESHSIKLIIRAYCSIRDYEEAYYWCTEKTKAAMGSNGVKVAYSEDMTLGDISV